MLPYLLLSTRTLPPSLSQRGEALQIIQKDFIAVRPLISPEKEAEVRPWLTRKEPLYVILSSAQAVEALGHWLHTFRADAKGWQVFCMSGKTGGAVSTILTGSEIRDTAESSGALAEKILAAGIREAVFFCGNRRREELPRLLGSKGITLHEVVVYETEETPEALDTTPFNGILFFSPSAVHSFFSSNQLLPSVVCFAIGPTTAAALKQYTPNTIITSEYPAPEQLIATAEHYFKHNNNHR